MLHKDENDNTYHPHRHAYSPHKKKGEKEVCWYCGKDKGTHKQQVVIEDGKRLVISV
jgi:hypothetical protein